MPSESGDSCGRLVTWRRRKAFATSAAPRQCWSAGARRRSTSTSSSIRIRRVAACAALDQARAANQRRASVPAMSHPSPGRLAGPQPVDQPRGTSDVQALRPELAGAREGRARSCPGSGKTSWRCRSETSSTRHGCPAASTRSSRSSTASQRSTRTTIGDATRGGACVTDQEPRPIHSSPPS
jgi:hypothetical protein